MRQTLEAQLEETVNRFYEILAGTPKFYHNAEEGPRLSPTCLEQVTLIFAGGEEVNLMAKGDRSYGFDSNGRLRYDAASTATQIEEIIGKRGQEPVTVRYQLVDKRYTAPQAIPIIEFSFEHVKAKLANPTLDIPYEVVSEYRYGI